MGRQLATHPQIIKLSSTSDRTRRKVGGGSLTDDNAKGENRETDGQCAAANAKELVEVERDDLGTIAKKTCESRPELVSSGRRCLSLRQVHNYPEWPVCGQLPTNDEFLGMPVQIPFGERKRIECVKQLGDVFDAYFDRVWRRR